MKKKLLLLLFLLALLLLLAPVVLQEQEKEASASQSSNFVLSNPFLDTREADGFVVFDGHFIKPSYSPVHIEDKVLGVKTEKIAEKSNLATKKGNDCPYYNLISQYDWNIDSACKIMMCESAGRPNAHNFNHSTRDNSFGLFQINRYGSLSNKRPSAEWLKIPENNIEYAYKIFISEGRRFGTTGGWYNCSKKLNIR